MTPSARIQAAIEILSSLDSTAKPVDRFLRDWFRGRRYAGSKDRAAVAERIFVVLRRRASLSWRMQTDNPRALVIASLLREGHSLGEIESHFDGRPYGPAPLSDDERKAIEAGEQERAPESVRGDFPAFLQGELDRAFGADLIEEMQAFHRRAEIDLRVNTLRATRDGLLREIQAAKFEAVPTPHAPFGVRIPSGSSAGALSSTTHFLAGMFEFQDESSQIAARLCAAKPGDRVLDLAAGAGGKSLALAADMNDRGVLVACDPRAPALAELALRSQRAGVSIIQTAESPVGEFDIVLVDAPCSGSGAWRRQPELKWRLTAERLAELRRTQDRLLVSAAEHVSPGGRLVYATCSVLPSENEDRIDSFLAGANEFAPIAASTVWQSLGGPAVPGLGKYFRASPKRTGSDGFFTAILERRL